jgi:hypothetical protein
MLWPPYYGDTLGLYPNAAHLEYLASFLSRLVPPAATCLTCSKPGRPSPPSTNPRALRQLAVQIAAALAIIEGDQLFFVTLDADACRIGFVRMPSNNIRIKSLYDFQISLDIPAG